MVPVLAKPGQNGGQILLDDVKTCKKKIILQNAHLFYNLHWEAFLMSTILRNKNTASTKCQQTKSSPELLVPCVLIMTDILERFLGKVDSLVRGLTILY